MKKVFVRKIFPYDPTFDGLYSRYEGYIQIGKQELDPGIESVLEVKLPPKINGPIMTSTLKRAVMTGEFMGKKLNLPILENSKINEIKFNLDKLVTIQEFEKFGSIYVRKGFIKAFVKDELEESRDGIKTRIDGLVKEIENFSPGEYLIVSHSFLMKIFQIYLTEPELFNEPEIIYNYFDPAVKTFQFGEGFEFELE